MKQEEIQKKLNRMDDDKFNELIEKLKQAGKESKERLRIANFKRDRRNGYIEKKTFL